MLSPHESLSLNQARGLLAADMGYPTFNPGFVDIYDVSEDCRHPVLKSSTPLGVLGHEGGFSPDGNTFWVSVDRRQTISALDVTDPTAAAILVDRHATTSPHGINSATTAPASTSPTSAATALGYDPRRQRGPGPQSEPAGRRASATSRGPS